MPMTDPLAIMAVAVDTLVGMIPLPPLDPEVLPHARKHFQGFSEQLVHVAHHLGVVTTATALRRIADQLEA